MLGRREEHAVPPGEEEEGRTVEVLPEALATPDAHGVSRWCPWVHAGRLAPDSSARASLRPPGLPPAPALSKSSAGYFAGRG